jgi:hypothetical protein
VPRLNHKRIISMIPDNFEAEDMQVGEQEKRRSCYEIGGKRQSLPKNNNGHNQED